MAKKENTIRFSVSLSEKLLKEMDRRVVNKGYSSRSEFIRDLIREKIVEDKWQTTKEEVVGILSISYDHHQRDLTERIMHAQHSRYVNILCSTHVHLDHNNCLETIIMKGSPPEIEKISIEISGIRGVKFAKLTRASKVES
ncbi:MAG: nickel-responsive transcriptional regulator NikR [Candidatus Latescibacteria bacterium]|nr:nickel-responsive transcriptional regulator NikR [Candidatus Latescibacterota bacterium]NIO28460.1 nickel-responsive transcriptional regulator NikR [Candidatus Latescibacterota bacterium]NIO56009.1 nickel-responsive transcriptional regulator NikR [Candidatus Latescibacterota bacterium]NIT01973.1 nickel-responsive transcriptional regulator NikR [Candidatus Latescibacterota bacterium]